MLQEFNKKKILLAYYGGSTAYQTTNENSDKDVIVVLDNFDGYDHLAVPSKGVEYFIFGKEQFIDKMNFDKTITPYLLIFNDDILADVPPITLDESFVETYEAIRNRPFGEFMKDYLGAVITYYGTLLKTNTLRKNMYHLYRIEEQVKRYLETESFTLGVSEDTLEKMMVLKDNYQTNNVEILTELKAILNYLKGVQINECN